MTRYRTNLYFEDTSIRFTGSPPSKAAILRNSNLGREYLYSDTNPFATSLPVPLLKQFSSFIVALFSGMFVHGARPQLVISGDRKAIIGESSNPKQRDPCKFQGGFTSHCATNASTLISEKERGKSECETRAKELSFHV
ncbi:hypothetical protein PoB_001932800 [Plakobranchus ocellatus]|uniref:Uncharacterized protein n=1 Tax=Plakobranchus ocellatus TaxID=259542 RepID=A0AAV3ZDK9_9GAST|nr:hypothetical protein PoB_001932800 [Plakobranchus ocellatus]